jgi:hypothetical protein
MISRTVKIATALKNVLPKDGSAEIMAVPKAIAASQEQSQNTPF